MAQSGKSCIFLMADYGHDPTETAIPWSVFKASSFSITFATESGKPPQCDSRLLTGLSATLLGADAAAKKAYTSLSESPEFQSPLSWTSSDFSLQAYDLVFLPGGHDKGVRQIIDSADVARLLGEYWPLTRGTPGGRPRGKKTVGAICHGVQVLSMATEQGSGKSVLHDAKTTALPGFFEGAAFQATRLFLGDYYKTYGYGSQNVEDVVKGKLDDPATQWVGSRSPTTPLVVEDDKHNYLSGRWPGDAEALAKRVVSVVENATR